MESCEIEVRLTARGGADRIEGERDGVLRARVAAPPVDGAANDSLCRMVARAAGVGRRSVTIVSGERSRNKRLRIEGVDGAQLRAVLGLDVGGEAGA